PARAEDQPVHSYVVVADTQQRFGLGAAQARAGAYSRVLGRGELVFDLRRIDHLVSPLEPSVVSMRRGPLTLHWPHADRPLPTSGQWSVVSLRFHWPLPASRSAARGVPI